MIITARAYNLPISRKHSVEVARFIKGKKLKEALRILEEIIELKTPVKLTKHHRGVAHKKKIGPGRYPVKVAKYIKKVLLSAKSNGKNKNIDEEKLDNSLIFVEANKGQTLYHGGRKIGRKRKATHIFVKLLVEEDKRGDNQ
ncbi:MAG TPA: 50S ribosomal protein L22 [Nautiliaceae bacterium]|nr:50S ribosomal protein L22 [Nautiliaceae bacterium]